MKTCKICGCSFDEENCEGVVVNEGMDSEYFVCCDCVPDECNRGRYNRKPKTIITNYFLL